MKMNFKFFKKNGNLILTGVGVVGLFSTIGTCIKETENNVRKIDELEKELGHKLSKKQKVRASIPNYKKTIVSGVLTTSCFVGAAIVSKRNQASLMAAYSALNKSYKAYKKEVKELYGEEADKTIKENIIKKNVGTPIDEIIDEKDEVVRTFYDPIGCFHFENTISNVLNAAYRINKKYAEDGFADMDDFYKFAGIKTKYKNMDQLGWHLFYTEKPFINIELKKCILDDGMEVILIDYIDEPEACFVDHI